MTSNFVDDSSLPPAVVQIIQASSSGLHLDSKGVPSFSGSTKDILFIREYVNKMKRLINFKKIETDALKIEYMALSFSGAAASWADGYTLRNTLGIATFDHFVTEFYNNFMNGNYEYDVVLALVYLSTKHTNGNLLQYTELYFRFLSLLRDGILGPTGSLYFYVCGLPPMIQANVRLNNPQTIEDAFRMAQQANALTNTAVNEIARAAVAEATAEAAAIAAGDPSTISAARTTYQRGTPSASSISIEQCKKDGLCFNCKKKGHRAQNCHVKRQ